MDFTDSMLQVGPGPGYVLTVDGYQADQSTLDDKLFYNNGNKFQAKWVQQ